MKYTKLLKQLDTLSKPLVKLTKKMDNTSKKRITLIFFVGLGVLAFGDAIIFCDSVLFSILSFDVSGISIFDNIRGNCEAGSSSARAIFGAFCVGYGIYRVTKAGGKGKKTNSKGGKK